MYIQHQGLQLVFRTIWVIQGVFREGRLIRVCISAEGHTGVLWLGLTLRDIFLRYLSNICYRLHLQFIFSIINFFSLMPVS